MDIGAGLIWTANCIVFLALFTIWSKGNLFNFCIKVLFLGLAIVNSPPAWAFLQSAIR